MKMRLRLSCIVRGSRQQTATQQKCSKHAFTPDESHSLNCQAIHGIRTSSAQKQGMVTSLDLCTGGGTAGAAVKSILRACLSVFENPRQLAWGLEGRAQPYLANVRKACSEPTSTAYLRWLIVQNCSLLQHGMITWQVRRKRPSPGCPQSRAETGLPHA